MRFHHLQCETILELLAPLMDFIEDHQDPDLFALYRKVENFSELHSRFRNQLGLYKIKARRDLEGHLQCTCEVISSLSVSICLLLGEYLQKHKHGLSDRGHELGRLSSTYYMKWVCRMRAHGMKIPSLRALYSGEES